MNKKDIRKYYKNKRAQFTSEELRVFSKSIINNFYSNFSFSYSKIHVFLPILLKNEPDIFPLIDRLFKNKNRIFTSIVKNDILEHTEIFSDTEYDTDAFGIPIPKNCTNENNLIFDVIIVPLLYCDKNGNRIGYGKGYYDKFLITQPTSLKIGIGFFAPDIDIEDVEPHDVPITKLIGPNFVYDFLHER